MERSCQEECRLVVLAAVGPLPFPNGTVHCALSATPREPAHHLPTHKAMTTDPIPEGGADFRALCAELLEWADRSSAHYYVKPDLLTRAREALSQPAPKPPTDQKWEDEALNAYHTASIDPGTSARSPEPPAGPVKGPTLEDIDEMCERRNFGFYYDDWGPSDHDSRLVLQSMMVETLARWGKGNG